MRASLTLTIRDIPEVVQELRAALADILREEAESEPSGYVAARLREVAAAFECGQRPEGDAHVG